MGHSHSNHQRGWRAKAPPGPHLASDGPSLSLCTTLPWQSGRPEGCPLESYRWDSLKIIVRTGAGGAQATPGYPRLPEVGFLFSSGGIPGASVISGPGGNWRKPQAALFFLPIFAFQIEPSAAFTQYMPQSWQRRLGQGEKWTKGVPEPVVCGRQAEKRWRRSNGESYSSTILNKLGLNDVKTSWL